MKSSKPKFTVFKRKIKGKRDKAYTVEFLNWQYKIKKVKTKFTDKKLAYKYASQLAIEHDEIRRGIRKPPTANDKAMYQNLKTHIDKYIDWGQSHGGVKSGGWSKETIRKLKRHLKWWLDNTKWKSFVEINLSEAENILIEKSKQFRVVKNEKGQKKKVSIAGKTISNYKESLNMFVNWYCNVYKVRINPLDGMTKWNTSIVEQRRDLTIEEIARLLAVTPFERAIVYETAIITGLRSNELSHLKDENYSYEDSCIIVLEEHTKSREGKVIHLPEGLNKRLKKYIEIRGPYKRLFKFDFSHSSRNFDKDCKNAEVKKRAFGGKVVFHSLRDSHVNLGIDLGVDIKTGMEMSRHKTASIYLKKYAKRKNDKVIQATNEMGDYIEKAVDTESEKITANTLPKSTEPRRKA